MAIFRSVVSIGHASLGGQGSNTWHFRVTDGATIGDTALQLQGAADALEAFYTSVAGQIVSGASLSHAGEWTTVSEDPPEAGSSSPFTVTGTGSTETPSPLLCLVVGWRTILATKSGRGRTFLGPLSQTVMEGNGTPDEPDRADVQAAADTLISTFTGGGDGAFCVWSPLQSVGRDIMSAVTRNEFAYLSSRRD